MGTIIPFPANAVRRAASDATRGCAGLGMCFWPGQRVRSRTLKEVGTVTALHRAATGCLCVVQVAFANITSWRRPDDLEVQ